MTMKSKFQSICKACNCQINVGEEIEWAKGAGARHATPQQCADARALKIANQEAVVMDERLKPLADFITAARDRGLKHPKVRMLAPDGRTEMRIGLTREGVMPGSISVVLDHQFIGCVRPNGQTTGELSKNPALQDHLMYVAKDPARAAREYASLTARCSFCNDPLTDAGSVEVGYGPVCAKRYGLPHKPQGTPRLSVAPVEENK